MQRSSLLYDSDDSDSDPFQSSSNQHYSSSNQRYSSAFAQGGQESQRLAELNQENTDELFQQQAALMAAGDDIDPMLLACQGGGAFMAEQFANQELGSPSTDGGDSPDRKLPAIDVKQPSVLVKDEGDGSEFDADLMSMLMVFDDPYADDSYDTSKEDEDVEDYDVADFFSGDIGPREGTPASNASSGSSVVEIITSKISQGCTRLTDMITGVGKRSPVTREISSSEAKSRPGAPPVGTKKKRGPEDMILPKPSQEEQARLYNVFKSKIREADDKHERYFGRSRGPTIPLLEDTLAPSKLKSGELHKLGQGKCGVPLHRNGVSIEGDTLPADDNKFNANASATGWRALGDGLPYTGCRTSRHIYPYQRRTSRQSDLLGLNCRDGCIFSKGDNGEEHCEDPTLQEIEITLMILEAIIEYLVNMGCFVMILNIGGWAVKPMLEQLHGSLPNLIPSFVDHVLVVPSSTHMYRLAYCIGDPIKVTNSVSKHMKRMSNSVDKFLTRVNAIRSANRIYKPIKYKNGMTLYENLVRNPKVPFVADKDLYPDSIANRDEKAHEQAVARGKLGAAALAATFESPEAFKEHLSKLGQKSWEARLAKYSPEEIKKQFSEMGQKSWEARLAKMSPEEIKEQFSEMGQKSWEARLAKFSPEEIKEHFSKMQKKSWEAQLRNLKENNIDPGEFMSGLGIQGYDKRAEKKMAENKVSKKEAKSLIGKQANKGLRNAVERGEKGGGTIKDYMSSVSELATGKAKSEGKDIAKKKVLLQAAKEGKGIYVFNCKACSSKSYEQQKDNMWEKSKQTNATSKRCSNKCWPNDKILPRPPCQPGMSSSFWTYKGKLEGDEKVTTIASWETEVEAYEQGKRDHTRGRARKAKKERRKKRNNK